MREVSEAGISFLKGPFARFSTYDYLHSSVVGGGAWMSICGRVGAAMLAVLAMSAGLGTAQEAIRIEPLPPTTGLSGAGGVVTNPSPLNLNSTLSPPPSAPPALSPNLGGAAATAPPLSSATSGETGDESAPAMNSLLLSAHSLTGNSGGECDITDAARQTCSGEDCLLSCPSDACPNQESEKCEFVIDCVAEIAADAASDDQQCDEQYIEHSTIESEGKSEPVTIIRIPVGQTCKPPPCSK